jgi:DtxR family Mn-dependent transcriptional regulator
VSFRSLLRRRPTWSRKLAELQVGCEYTPYQSIKLTPYGERVALEVLRHHRLLELYLHDKLDLTWDQVHAEAERLEHVMSDVLEDAIAAALGHPTVRSARRSDPDQGWARVEAIDGEPLSDAEAIDCGYRLVRVLLQDSARLNYLGSLGLYPNV